VESDELPLRLMLGADAYELWEKKSAAMNEELVKWRKVGEDPTFAGVKVGRHWFRLILMK
jgi:hypothetical protein